jgi:hypothetical protein
MAVVVMAHLGHGPYRATAPRRGEGEGKASPVEIGGGADVGG